MSSECTSNPHGGVTFVSVVMKSTLECLNFESIRCTTCFLSGGAETKKDRYFKPIWSWNSFQWVMTMRKRQYNFNSVRLCSLVPPLLREKGQDIVLQIHRVMRLVSLYKPLLEYVKTSNPLRTCDLFLMAGPSKGLIIALQIHTVMRLGTGSPL